MPDTVQTRHVPPYRSFVALACFVLVAVIGLTADLWTKAAAWDHLVEKDEQGQAILIEVDDQGRVQPARRADVVVIPKVLELTAVANLGAALGLGQGRKTLFIFVSIAAVGVLCYFFAYSDRRRLYQIVLGLLLAGVLGNLYDRVVHGYVRDMIHVFPGVYWADLHSSLPRYELFPWVFNLADVFLCVGVPAVLLYGLFATPDERAAEFEGGDASQEPAGQADS